MKENKGSYARLFHIADSISEIETYTKGFTFEDFVKNSLVVSATLKQLEIIGEASKHVSDDIKEKYNEIDWKALRDFRNVLVHDYFGIDYTIVWDVIRQDLPDLKIQINNIINNLKEN